MKSQLYLYEGLRTRLKSEIQLIVDTFNKRISPVFKDIEIEAQEEADKHYNSFLNSSYGGEDYYIDLSSIADDSREVGINYIQAISLMKYNNLAAWLTILYQFWEQQVRLFLFDELRRYFEIDPKNFCANGIKDIKEVFIDHKVNIEKLHSWAKIEELRLLCNTIKHGDGNAARSLSVIRPDIIASYTLQIDLTTLNQEVLNITEEMVSSYGTSLIKFWDELDERMYSG